MSNVPVNVLKRKACYYVTLPRTSGKRAVGKCRGCIGVSVCGGSARTGDGHVALWRMFSTGSQDW